MLSDTVMDYALRAADVTGIEEASLDRALADATAPTPAESEMAHEIPRHAGCERQIRAGMSVANGEEDPERWDGME
jgi:hypothetical protein